MAELEQLIAADLTHPAIVTPIATGVAGVTAYLAQDFVAAESLDTHLREHRAASAPSEVVRVIAQVAAALDVAASGRIVHGALHPRDLLVSSDDVRVTGLGIARALERVGITAPVRRPYTAPERVGGRAWDRRADVFSLAVLAYEMLWGRRPSASGARAADGVTDIPGADLEALRAVFVRAMAETFTDRFDSAERFVDALRGALGRAADAVEAEPVLTDRMRSTSPIDAIDAIVPVDAAEPIDTAARGDDGRLFDLDQFRRADAIERFQPEGPASNVLPGPFPPAEKGTADEEEIKSGVEALSDSTETAGEPPVQEPRAPRKVVRSEADRRPKTRERPPAPDVRGARAESSLFREPAEAGTDASAGERSGAPGRSSRPGRYRQDRGGGFCLGGPRPFGPVAAGHGTWRWRGAGLRGGLRRGRASARPVPGCPRGDAVCSRSGEHSGPRRGCRTLGATAAVRCTCRTCSDASGTRRRGSAGAAPCRSAHAAPDPAGGTGVAAGCGGTANRTTARSRSRSRAQASAARPCPSGSRGSR